ncbi:phospholipase D-like domain-containing protein [Prevotella multiformis]|uniref:Phospholipase D domain protein n=1 Tax=Prevotella multiformis DSM 16608 TaxID=888743 RepID=F0F5P8_9BACT|nr:phospholipase D-like domain-containing protein [Prevotella multiformis]EGC20667.1 phospholipase D domain protein [Prevotella multiformis DSM 16608]
MREINLNHKKRNAITAVMALCCLSHPSPLSAQKNQQNAIAGGLSSTETRADSLLVSQLRRKGVRFSHNNSVTLLTTGQEKFDDLFKAIDQARSSIHLEYFNFRNDSINEELIRRLAAKAKEGIEVRAVFDGFGNASNNRPMRKRRLKAIRKQGIEIHEFKPMAFPWLHDIFNRDHRKIIVIDGKVAYTGGMNVADYYIKGTKAVGSWHDMHCRIEGDEVNTLQKIFLRMWRIVSGQDVHGAKYYRGVSDADYMAGLKPDTCRSAGKKMVGIINREPHVTKDIIRCFYLNAIKDAKDSIKLINPYFSLSHSLKKALRDAVSRGVKVEILLSMKSDIPLTPDCGFYNAHQLMKAGCTIWIYKPGFHHTKIITIDGQLCTVGSANLNARSLRWDREENAVIVDACTTHELNQLFEDQKKDSFKLTEAKWKQWRTPWQRFRGWFAHLLSPFL